MIAAANQEHHACHDACQFAAWEREARKTRQEASREPIHTMPCPVLPGACVSKPVGNFVCSLPALVTPAPWRTEANGIVPPRAALLTRRNCGGGGDDGGSGTGDTKCRNR